jgi:hypothetical protein
VRAEWQGWLDRWDTSLDRLRSAAPPVPITEGDGVTEYLQVHNAVRNAIDRLGSIRYQSGQFGVPTGQDRTAYFQEVTRHMAGEAATLRALRAAVR